MVFRIIFVAFSRFWAWSGINFSCVARSANKVCAVARMCSRQVASRLLWNSVQATQ